MDADQFAQIGEICFGPSWQNAIAACLNVNSRRVRSWLRGDAIPEGVRGDLLLLMRDRAREINMAADRIFGGR